MSRIDRELKDVWDALVPIDEVDTGLCEDEVAEGVIRGVLDPLNIKLGLRHEDIVVGRNTGRSEFPSHIRMLGKFHKLADFVVVLDGDSRAMENELKAVAKEYGHPLEPIFLPVSSMEPFK